MDKKYFFMHPILSELFLKMFVRVYRCYFLYNLFLFFLFMFSSLLSFQAISLFSLLSACLFLCVVWFLDWPCCGYLPFTKKNESNPYLKILDFSQLFVADAPLKKLIQNFSFTSYQKSVKSSREERVNACLPVCVTVQW